MSEVRNKNRGGSALLSAAVAAWLIYDMTTATEAPSRALALLQYVLLACALFGLIGSAAKYLSQR